MMGNTPDRRKHDLIQALRILTSLVEFIDDGIDFNSEEGLSILEEARQAKRIIESEIETIAGSAGAPAKN
jgi:hypothetical protein